MIEVLNDHRNLTYFRESQNLNRRQACWSLFLSRFDFSLIHRPGRHSAKPDALSRRKDHLTKEGDNQDQVMLPAERFDKSSELNESVAVTGDDPTHVTLEGEEGGFLERVRDCADRDDSVIRALKELGTERGLQSNEWQEKDILVLYRGKIYVPRDSQLRLDIVKAHHDYPVAGHPGRWKTTELIAHNFWWPRMGRYIADYVKGCDLCNHMKTFPTSPTGKLMPNRIPDRCWQVILVDLITELPPSRGYDAIMVVVDHLYKRTHVIPTTSDVTAARVAKLFRDHVWKLHGLPEAVISDRGTQFVSNFTQSLSQLLGIRVAASMAYHLQMDGQTEWVNQEVEQFLRLFVNQQQDDWYEWLAIAEFAYNDRIHASTCSSPFMMDTIQNP